MKYLQVKNVSKSFIVENKENKILDNLDFEINKGEFISVIGSSGCGKTTLLRILAGFEETTSGQVICNNEKISNPKMKYAYIFQEFNQLLPWKTVKQNIIYPLVLNKRYTSEECEIKANEYLNLIGLQEYANYYPYALSGGMKQRVAIARALAMQPEVLFMDEPFSCVDSHTREKLHEELLTIWRKLNLTIVFITHNIEEAIHLSTRIIVLSDKPAKITQIFNNRVTGKKTPADDGYAKLWNDLHEIIKNTKGIGVNLK